MNQKVLFFNKIPTAYLDGYNSLTQSSIILMVFNDRDVICYGDEIYMANFSYLNQRLAIDRKNSGYVPTRKNALDRWIIESADKLLRSFIV